MQQATLKRIAAIGYTELEVLQPTLATVAPIASSLGLSIASVHLDGATAKGDGFESFLTQAMSMAYGTWSFLSSRPPIVRPTARDSTPSPRA